mgnify:CR=1 FL=1
MNRGRSPEYNQLTAFLRRDRVYIMAFGFVTARRDAVANENWFETAREFKRRFNIPDELFSDEVLIRKMQEMTVEFIHEGI